MIEPVIPDVLLALLTFLIVLSVFGLLGGMFSRPKDYGQRILCVLGNVALVALLSYLWSGRTPERVRAIEIKSEVHDIRHKLVRTTDEVAKQYWTEKIQELLVEKVMLERDALRRKLEEEKYGK